MKLLDIIKAEECSQVEYKPLQGLEEINFFSKVWENYRDAMSRKRPDSVLSKYRFIKHAITNSGIYHSKFGVVLYQEWNGFKVPTHFAPNSLKAGYKLVKELYNSGDWIIIVPEDLMVQCKKIGFSVLPFTTKTQFNGEEIEKYICLPSDIVLAMLVQQALLLLKRLDIASLSNLFSWQQTNCDLPTIVEEEEKEEFIELFDHYFYGGEEPENSDEDEWGEIEEEDYEL